jgi:Family of unknown function (DUF6447)
MAQMVKIDDVDYDVEKLSQAARAQLMHLRIIEVETARLQAQLAIHQTARVAYANALREELAKNPQAPTTPAA